MRQTHIILILLLSFTAPLWGKVSPRTQNLAEKFKTLSRDEQKKVLKAVQKFMVGIDAKEFERLSPKKKTVFLQILDQLMSQAYAQEEEPPPPPPEEEFAEEEAPPEETEETREPSHLCLYGGFYSEMTGSYCTHPLRSPNEEHRQTYRKACDIFEKEEHKNKCRTDDLKLNVCNPVLFGDKRAEGFFERINAGVNYGKFTSYNCLINSSDEADENNHLSIISTLVENKDGELEEFIKLLESIFDMCLCPPGEAVFKIHQAFKDRHFGSNTCMALLYQSRKLLEDTGTLAVEGCSQFNQTNAQNLNDINSTLKESIETSLDAFESYLGEKEIKLEVISEKLSQYEEDFSKFLTSEEKKEALKGFCDLGIDINKERESPEEPVASTEEEEKEEAVEATTCLESLTMELENDCDKENPQEIPIAECTVKVTLSSSKPELCKKDLEEYEIVYKLATEEHPFEQYIQNQEGKTKSGDSQKFNRVYQKDYEVMFRLTIDEQSIAETTKVPLAIPVQGQGFTRENILKGHN